MQSSGIYNRIKLILAAGIAIFCLPAPGKKSPTQVT